MTRNGDVFDIKKERNRTSDLADTTEISNAYGIETDRDRTPDLADTLADEYGIGHVDELDADASMHEDDIRQNNPNEDKVVDFFLDDDHQVDEDSTQTYDEGTINDAQSDQFKTDSETEIPINMDAIDEDLNMTIGQWSHQTRRSRRIHKLNPATSFQEVLGEEHNKSNNCEEDEGLEKLDMPGTEQYTLLKTAAEGYPTVSTYECKPTTCDEPLQKAVEKLYDHGVTKDLENCASGLMLN